MCKYNNNNNNNNNNNKRVECKACLILCYQSRQMHVLSKMA